ncbi:diguanylate cyclase [Niveibacterium sp. SC-1]|uniref:sensor domain-containing diguanylate cyclase n=1 Tax=Niveibacterium sp. SC-1 TaxID=3135646 RepID=UPI00311D7268
MNPLFRSAWPACVCHVVWLVLFSLLLVPALGLPAYAASARGLQDLQRLVDATGGLDVDAARASAAWAPADAQPAPRYTRDAIWLRGSFVLPGDASGPLMEIDPPSLDVVDLWLYDATGRLVAHLRDGDERPGLRRYLDNRVPLLRLPVVPGERYEAVLRVAGEGLLDVRVSLWAREADFLAHERSFLMLYGGFFGALLVMALYNLFLAFGARLAQYRRYTFFTLAVCLFVASLNGMGPLYLWGGNAWVRAHMLCFAPNLAYLTAITFVLSYLEVRRHSLALYRITQVFFVAFSVLALASLVLTERELMPWLEAVALLLTIWALFVPIYLTLKGVRQAYFFLAAWLVLLAANFINALRPYGLVPTNAFTIYAQTYGFLIEALVLSLGLADLIKQERIQRERATDESLALTRTLQQQTQAMLNFQRETNESLERKVDERTRRLAETLAELEAANQQLESLVRTDPLTGLFNRRHLEPALDREIARARRQSRAAALFALDIDRFKSVNDRFGHPVGDLCLAAVAQVIRESCRRAGDMAVRLGGEEFVAWYPVTDRAGAALIAQELLDAVRALALHDASGAPFGVTISIGVALYEPGSGTSGDALVAQADGALYAAKRAGRDRAVFAEDLAPEPAS